MQDGNPSRPEPNVRKVSKGNAIKFSFRRRFFWKKKNSNNLLQNQIKILVKTQIKFLWCYNTYPLRKNLVPEISADPQTGVGVLPEANPLFPMLLHPQCDYSIEP